MMGTKIRDFAPLRDLLRRARPEGDKCPGPIAGDGRPRRIPRTAHRRWGGR